MKSALSFVLLAASAVGAEAQEGRPWYSPGARIVNLRALDRTISDTTGLARSIDAPVTEAKSVTADQVGRVFSALAGVYAALKIPAEIRDSSRLILGTQQFYRRSDLGGRSLAMYLECGQDVHGLWAEIYRISMSLVTFLTPSGGNRIEVRTVLFGTAVDIPRAQPNTRECRSTGALEQRIHEMAVKALAKEGYSAPVP